MADPARLLDLLELAIAPIELGLAIVVYAAAPRQTENRALAVLFGLEGLGIGGFTNGLDTFIAGPQWAAAFQVTLFSIWVGSVVYVLFITASLDSAATRPLRGPLARGGLVALAVIAAAAFPFLPRDVLARFIVVLWVMVVTALYGLLATTWTFVASPRGTPQRKRAQAYLLAFALRDVGIFLIASHWLLGLEFGGWMARQGPWISFWASTLWIPFLAAVAYGTLRGQLFDIDARVQRLLQRTVIVAVGAVAFFALSEGLEAVVPSASAWVGLAGAALITLALWPLQRIVGRVTDRLVPNADDPEQVRLRKEEVYLTALAAAQEDGRVGDRERRVLDGLRDRLGLTAEAAGRLEASGQLH